MAGRGRPRRRPHRVRRAWLPSSPRSRSVARRRRAHRCPDDSRARQGGLRRCAGQADGALRRVPGRGGRRGSAPRRRRAPTQEISTAGSSLATGPAPWSSSQRPLSPREPARLSVSAADDALAHRSLGAGRPRPPRVPEPWRPTRERCREPRAAPPPHPRRLVGRSGQRAPRRARRPRHEPPRPDVAHPSRRRGRRRPPRS